MPLRDTSVQALLVGWHLDRSNTAEHSEDQALRDVVKKKKLSSYRCCLRLLLSQQREYRGPSDVMNQTGFVHMRPCPTPQTVIGD